MNSKAKGKNGELEFAKFLRDHGFQARRGVQYEGSSDSPDVVSSLPYHFEVKRVEKLNLAEAFSQAIGESKGLPPVVAHRRNRGDWMVTLKASDFLDLVRNSDFPPIGPYLIPPWEPPA